jgi:hypothetical protein
LRNKILVINKNELYGIQSINPYHGSKARALNFGQNRTSCKFSPNVPKLELFVE